MKFQIVWWNNGRRNKRIQIFLPHIVCGIESHYIMKGFPISFKQIQKLIQKNYNLERQYRPENDYLEINKANVSLVQFAHSQAFIQGIIVGLHMWVKSHLYLYITKSWSVAFNASTLILSHISNHVIFLLFYEF